MRSVFVIKLCVSCISWQNQLEVRHDISHSHLKLIKNRNKDNSTQKCRWFSFLPMKKKTLEIIQQHGRYVKTRYNHNSLNVAERTKVVQSYRCCCCKRWLREKRATIAPFCTNLSGVDYVISKVLRASSLVLTKVTNRDTNAHRPKYRLRLESLSYGRLRQKCLMVCLRSMEYLKKQKKRRTTKRLSPIGQSQQLLRHFFLRMKPR